MSMAYRLNRKTKYLSYVIINEGPTRLFGVDIDLFYEVEL